MGDEAELIAQGWRRCAIGQTTTQWCAQAEEQRQRDEELLRMALEALEQIARDLPWELTGLQADTLALLRDRLGGERHGAEGIKELYNERTVG